MCVACVFPCLMFFLCDISRSKRHMKLALSSGDISRDRMHMELIAYITDDANFDVMREHFTPSIHWCQQILLGVLPNTG